MRLDVAYSRAGLRALAPGLLRLYTTYPAVERLELLRRTLFCFLTGGEDMHLKNFSLITRGRRIQLAPAYDLVNSTIALVRATKELALPLRGKKRNLQRTDFLTYFARERLELRPAVIDDVLASLREARATWENLIAASFLPVLLQQSYRELLAERSRRLLD